MKNIFSKLILGMALGCFSTFSLAAANECNITYTADDDLTSLIKKKKFDFENYDKVCAMLKKANAGVVFNTITQVTPYQTSASVVIRLKALEFDDQDILLMSSKSSSWVRYEEARTSQAEKDALYALSMAALDDLSQELVDSLNAQRKALRASYKNIK